jgi:putative chitinase
MKLTEEQLAAMLPTNREIAEWCKVLNSALPKYEINNARRIAAFISQCAHESRDFTAMEENLNYSSRRWSVFRPLLWVGQAQRC